jgi:hypothetical protein
VSRSFSVEAKIRRKSFRIEAKKEFVISLVSLRSETLEIPSKTKMNEAKKLCKTKKEPKNYETKMP